MVGRTPGPQPTPRSAHFRRELPGKRGPDLMLYSRRLPHIYEIEGPVFLTWRLFGTYRRIEPSRRLRSGPSGLCRTSPFTGTSSNWPSLP